MSRKAGPVKVYKNTETGNLEIGVQMDSSATVQDLLNAWQPLCDDQTIYKQFAEGNYAGCKGCRLNCCSTAYVIPDLVSFKKMAGEFQLDYSEFIREYFQPEKLQVGLLRLLPNPCVFLADNICSIYGVRSLICRFYLCTPLQGDTEELIYKIAWSGAAATQIFAEQEGLLPPRSSGSSSFDRLFLEMLEQYRGSAGVESFLQARDYSDIPCQIFLAAGKETK